jgi:hypothetical protein
MNPTGHWEPVDATNLNVEFISRHGLVGDPSMRLQEIDIDESEREDYVRKIQAFLSGCPQGPALVIKEFRINELMEFWLEAARRDGFSVKVAIAIRHPQEVFASTKATLLRPQSMASAASETLTIERFNTFWLKVNLLAERHSRGLPRVFIHYSNLLKDWRVEVARVSKTLSIDLEVDETSIDDFVTPDLHRQVYSGPITETFGYSWITRVYAILSAAAQDGPIDLPSLDEIYHAYRASARAFRTPVDDVENRLSTQRLREFVDRLPILKSDRDS